MSVPTHSRIRSSPGPVVVHLISGRDQVLRPEWWSQVVVADLVDGSTGEEEPEAV